MIVTFVAPTARAPIGGVTMIYELANSLARRGHVVHIYHHSLRGDAFTSVDEIEWFDFEATGVNHHFPGLDPGDTASLGLPNADIFFGYTADLDDTPSAGLPVVLIQGWQMLDEQVERLAYEAPCPKLCVATWLVDVGVELGIPAEQLVHLPLGLRHDRYRLTRPIAGRGDHVGFLYSAHPKKATSAAIDIVTRLRDERPELRATAFGTSARPDDLPHWITYLQDPVPEVLVDQLYNRAAIFLWPSIVEGFGFPAVEAMAGGAALVTTDNGGSRDFADHGRTALVAEPNDVEALTAHVRTLLADPTRRAAIAEAGRAEVTKFEWDRTGRELEAFLERYLSNPGHYRPGPGAGDPSWRHVDYR